MSHPQAEDRIFYGTSTRVIARDESRSILKMENETGSGIMTCYPLLPGIELLYNDMHISIVRAEQNKLPCPDVMEINHCREGRFECEFSDGRAEYLGAGDLAVNMLTHPTRCSWFPLSHYHGISVMVDLPAATEALGRIGRAFGGMSIDLYALRARLCGGDTCFIMRATEEIQHIFSELYTAPTALRGDYCKLKVLELLLFLNCAELPALRESRAYITRTQADVIRAVRSFLTAHLDRHVTLQELSRQFDMPLTALKQNFKTVYGDTIGTYMQAYRMQKAMWLLQETALSITEIAGQIGYQNISKFSCTFRRFTGATPTEYRKIPRPFGAESVPRE